MFGGSPWSLVNSHIKLGGPPFRPEVCWGCPHPLPFPGDFALILYHWTLAKWRVCTEDGQSRSPAGLGLNLAGRENHLGVLKTLSPGPHPEPMRSERRGAPGTRVLKARSRVPARSQVCTPASKVVSAAHPPARGEVQALNLDTSHSWWEATLGHSSKKPSLQIACLSAEAYPS